MTEQYRDKIKFEGNEYSHFSFIFPYQEEKFEKIKFPYGSIVAPHTALRKGFHTKSEVIGGRLFLTEFYGYIKDNDVGRKEIGISDVVEDGVLPLHADWFSRSLICYLGIDLSLCKELLKLRFSNGVLCEVKTINKRQFFRNISIRSILEDEKNNVQLAFDHSNGSFREIRMRGEIFWIESFNDDEDNFQSYDEISRDEKSVTMRLKKYEQEDGEEYLVKVLLDEGKMKCLSDNGYSWKDLYKLK